MESTDELIFDSVEQVRLDSWHRGRVVLVGDAAWCPSMTDRTRVHPV
jgi:2-polyprenyl-6-methoxyphenol hydroxylase-like FAD-dependent oxidoreductase